MRLMYWCLACVLSVLHLTGFAGELKQGTLKNGIRYYLYSDCFERETIVAIAVQKTEQEAFVPLLDIFDSEENLDRMFHSQEVNQHFHHGSIVGATYEPASEALSYMATYLKNDAFCQEVIDDLRQDYEEDLEEIDVDEKREEVFKFLFGADFSCRDALFAKSDEEIYALCRGLFKPSKMAIIVTGSFDLLEMEKQLPLLFEDIQEDETLIDDFPFLPTRPVAIILKGKGILDLAFTGENQEEDAQEQEVSLYWYRFAPSFKNYVLNDLFFFTQFYSSLSFVSDQAGQFDHLDYYFPFEGQIPRFEVDERAFDRAKRKLKKIYQKRKSTIYETCINHFVLGIPEDLQLENQNLLSELEAVRPEDLRAFILETIQDIPIAREFDLD